MCDCGKDTVVNACHLVDGHTQSCGCVQKEKTGEAHFKDLTGQRFGKLTVLEKIENENNKKRTWWLCRCDCGNIIQTNVTSLTTGKRKSCGCLISAAEEELSKILQNKNCHFIKQYTFDDCKDERKLPFDFAIFKEKSLLFLVELNGQQHYYPFTFCGEDKTTKQKNFEDRLKKDKIKEEYCKKNNIPLLVIKYTNFDKLEEVFDDFYKQNGSHSI